VVNVESSRRRQLEGDRGAVLMRQDVFSLTSSPSNVFRTFRSCCQLLTLIEGKELLATDCWWLDYTKQSEMAKFFFFLIKERPKVCQCSYSRSYMAILLVWFGNVDLLEFIYVYNSAIKLSFSRLYVFWWTFLYESPPTKHKRLRIIVVIQQTYCKFYTEEQKGLNVVKFEERWVKIFLL
jgi:hypothetical protein